MKGGPEVFRFMLAARPIEAHGSALASSCSPSRRALPRRDCPRLRPRSFVERLDFRKIEALSGHPSFCAQPLEVAGFVFLAGQSHHVIPEARKGLRSRSKPNAAGRSAHDDGTVGPVRARFVSMRTIARPAVYRPFRGPSLRRDHSLRHAEPPSRAGTRAYSA